MMKGNKRWALLLLIFFIFGLGGCKSGVRKSYDIKSQEIENFSSNIKSQLKAIKSVEFSSSTGTVDVVYGMESEISDEEAEKIFKQTVKFIFDNRIIELATTDLEIRNISIQFHTDNFYCRYDSIKNSYAHENDLGAYLKWSYVRNDSLIKNFAYEENK